jgi:hypothetical protein
MTTQVEAYDGQGQAGSPRSISLATVLLSAAALFGVAYISLILFFALPSDGGLLPGSRSYGLLAADIANGGTFSSTYRPPLYPVFLAGLMLASAEWSEVALWLQGMVAVALGVAAVWMAARISKSTLAGVIAAGLYASHLLFHVEMLSERETVLFSVLNVAFLSIWLFGPPSRARHLSMAVVTALLYLTRPTGTLFVPLLCVLILVDRTSESFSSIARRIVSCMGVVVLLVLPWQVFVSQKVGDIRFSASTTSGVNLLKGNNPDLEHFFPMVDVDLYEPFIREIAAERGLSGPKSDEALKEIAVGYIVSEPLRALGRSVVKGLLLFSPLPLPLGKGELRRVNGEIEVHEFSWRDPRLILVAVLHALVVFGGVVACLRSDHEYLVKRFLLGASLVSGLFIMAHAATFPETRFRLPLDVLLIVAAASGYARLFGSPRVELSDWSAGGRDGERAAQRLVNGVGVASPAAAAPPDTCATDV